MSSHEVTVVLNSNTVTAAAPGPPGGPGPPGESTGMPPKYASNRMYNNSISIPGATNIETGYPATGYLFAATLRIDSDRTINRFAILSNSDTGGDLRVGIYRSRANGDPGDQVSEIGVYTADRVGLIQKTDLNIQVPTNLYWVIYCSQNIPATPPQWGISYDADPLIAYPYPAFSVPGVFNSAYIMDTGVITGALPASAGDVLDCRNFKLFYQVSYA